MPHYQKKRKEKKGETYYALFLQTTQEQIHHGYFSSSWGRGHARKRKPRCLCRRSG
jgi:hypothetical protein